MKVFIVKIGEPLIGEGFRERRMTLFARALVKNGSRVTWWTSDWNHQKKERRNMSATLPSAAEGIDIRMVSAVGYSKNMSIRRLLHHLIFSSRLITHLKAAERPDLIWACFPTVPTAIYLGWWAKKNAIPIVFDIRDISPDVIIENIPRPFKLFSQLVSRPVYRMLGRTFQGASGVSAVSPDYLRWAEQLADRYGGVRRSGVLPLGYETEPVSSEEGDRIRREFESIGLLNERSLKVVYSGGFGRSYDINTLLMAAELCHEAKLNVSFYLAGGGERDAEYRDRASGLTNVTFLGWISPTRLKVLLSLADVGVMPYAAGATQGLPNKLYEYMGNSLCIFNSLKGETQDFILKNGIGINYEPGDSRNLMSIIEAAVNDMDSVYSMGKAAASLLDEKFNSATLSQAMVDFSVDCGEINRSC
jgi:glycosyltransferase involved in cell wall biosynthesis